jgi:hypothetical protein
MSFPLSVAGRSIADPPALADLVRADSGPGNGQVVRGKRPAEWIVDLVADGVLAPRLAIGLAAALIHQTHAAGICEGARLARALGDPALGTLILRALDAHDTALLLANDPGSADGSVEDGLLAAAAVLCDLTNPTIRRAILGKLRNAGLRELELPMLLSHGEPDDLREWLPAVLAETLTEAETAMLSARGAREDEGGRLVAELLREREGLRP